jgi:hypothetical protein
MGNGPAEPGDITTGRGSFTARAVLLGAFMCVFIGVADPYATFYLQTSSLFLDYSVGGAMFLLLALVLVFNVALARVWRRLALRSGELIVVACMMLVAGAVSTMGLAGYLIPGMAAPHYLAGGQHAWQQGLLRYLPQWAAPLDADGGIRAIQAFYEGLKVEKSIRAGPWWSPAAWAESCSRFVEFTRVVPWRAWWRPLGLWAVFIMALYACTIALLTIIRKQWVEHERLTFPIARVPQELCAAAAEPFGRNSPLGSWLFWFGFAAPALVGSLRALHGYCPSVPDIPTSTSITGLGPMPLSLYLSFAVLGFTFLIPNRLAFSIWSLNLVSFAFRSVLARYGRELPNERLGMYGAAMWPSMGYQGMGALFVFVLGSLYFARGHLRAVALCVIGRGPEGYDRGEPASYRFAVIVLAASLGVMVAWMAAAGLPVFYAAAFVLIGVAGLYAMARVVAQCGISVTMIPIIPPAYMTSVFGSSVVGGAGVGALMEGWVWCGDIRTTVMSSAAHAMYLSREKSRGLFPLLMVAAALTFAASTLATIWLGYRHGAANLHKWYFIDGPTRACKWAVGEIAGGYAPHYAGYAWAAGGAVIMGGLLAANRLLAWWPLHPVGFLICSINRTDTLWGTVFLAWLAKAVIVKTGGNRALRLAERLFLGMVLGQFTTAGAWAIVDFFTGKVGNRIFWV